MDDDVLRKWREFATSLGATLAEELGMRLSPDGDAAALEARDVNRNAVILLPATNLPRLAVTLFDAWRQCREKGDAGLTKDLSDLTPAMEQLSLRALGGAVRKRESDTLRLVFSINGAPLFLDMAPERALALAEDILASLQAESSPGTTQQ